MNSMTARFHGSGFSRKAACPPGTIAQDPRGSSSNSRCESDSRMMMSSSAAITSAGVCSDPSRSAQSCVSSAAICAANDQRGLRAPLHLGEDGREPLGVCLVEGRAEDPRSLLAHHQRHPAGFGDLSPDVEGGACVGVGLGVRVGEHDREQIVGVRQRIFLRDQAAHRDADQVELAPGRARRRAPWCPPPSRGSSTGPGGSDERPTPRLSKVIDAQTGGHKRIDLHRPALEVVTDAVDEQRRSRGRRR